MTGLSYCLLRYYSVKCVSSLFIPNGIIFMAHVKYFRIAMIANMPACLLLWSTEMIL